MIYADDVMRDANYRYAKAKAEKRGQDIRYLAPEAWAQIKSDQVQALCEALVKEINREIESQCSR